LHTFLANSSIRELSSLEIQFDDDTILTTLQRDTTFVMSDSLELNCWVLGDDPSRVFAVKIARSEVVSFLKETIKDKTRSAYSVTLTPVLFAFGRLATPGYMSDTLYRVSFLGGY
jgi:hypothetical protein